MYTSPPPLEGLGREADQGWGEGLVPVSRRRSCAHQPPLKRIIHVFAAPELEHVPLATVGREDGEPDEE